MMKGIDERVDEGVLWWFGHVERMENDRIAKRIYVGECLKKGGLDGRQARRMVQDRSECWGFVRGNAWGVAGGMNPRP